MRRARILLARILLARILLAPILPAPILPAPILLIVAMLAGCAPRPADQRPAANVPEVFRGAPADTTASIADQKWWEIFQDEALQALIRKALADNYDVKIAANHVL